MLQLVNTTKSTCFTCRTIEEITSVFREHYRQRYATTDNLREWVEEASDDEILNEANILGFSLIDCDENEEPEEINEWNEDRFPGIWKDKANEFRTLTIELGLLSDSEDDSDAAEYEEQQFGDWADATISLLAKQNLESWKLNF